MARKKIVKSIFDYVDDNNLVDFMDLSKVPDVPQVPLERYEPARGMPANLNGILTPENAKRLEETAKRGMDQGGMEWYNLEPLRYAFVEQLGEKKGNEAFGRYIDYTAATSPRSTVAGNIRRGSHFYNLDRNGQQVGGLTNKDMPQGYGHIAHTTHDHKLREIEANGGLLPIKGPKVSSFAENLKGNQTPMTIDTHNFSAVRNDPKNKVSPTNTQYRYLEDFQSEIADKMGITPAQMQASVWIAGDTGVADARPFMAVFDDVVSNTAERNGVSKSQALRDFIGGKAPLYGLAGVTAAGAMTTPEEAEAAVSLRLLKEAPVAYSQLRKQLARDRQNGISPQRTVEKFIHDAANTNYSGKGGRDPNSFNTYARGVDGESAGEYWKAGVQGLYDELTGAGDDPMVKAAMDSWLESHLGRQAGLTQRQNREMMQAKVALGGAGAMAAAGASAGEATSPAERGFPAWPEFKDPNERLPLPTGGDIAESLFTVLGIPMAGLQGLVRGGYGLLNGEDLVTAGAEAAHMMGAEHKGGLMAPGGDSDEGFRRYGEQAEKTLAEAGMPAPLAKGAGFISRWVPSLLSPF